MRYLFATLEFNGCRYLRTSRLSMLVIQLEFVSALMTKLRQLLVDSSSELLFQRKVARSFKSPGDCYKLVVQEPQLSIS